MGTVGNKCMVVRREGSRRILGAMHSYGTHDIRGVLYHP